MPLNRLARTALALAAVVTGLAALPGAAATDRWEPYPPGVGGPWGGSVRRIVVDADGGLWAATGGGVYRSADGGDTWAFASEGFGSLDVTDVAVCGSGPAAVWAATAGSGLYVSRDAGTTWAATAASALSVAGRPQTRFSHVAVDPTDCDRVFAATFDDSTALFRSSDGGDTWTNLGSYAVSALAFAADGTLFVGTQDSRLYRLDPTGGFPS
ncbi:MAG: hypothetical protein D6708_13730, partial [Candidatus Dadabacteria bacterium]